MLGFVVCLLLYAVLSLQDVCVRMHCAHAAHVCCVWGKPTKGVRTIDSFRVRVNGLNGW